MPHIIVKLWPGKTDEQKTRLTNPIVEGVTTILGYGAQAVSVAFEEIAPNDWKSEVYEADIVGHRGQLTKKPGYDASSL
jgi:4-oxalocrotonate tautomerase